MSKPTLLEKARSIGVGVQKQVLNEEELDLAIAVVTGEVAVTQAGKAIGVPMGNYGSRCYTVLRAAIASGKIAKIRRKSRNGEL